MSNDAISVGNISTSQAVAIGPNAFASYTHLEVSKSDFFTPPLESYQPPHFMEPPIAPQITERLNDRHLLIIGGDPKLNKDPLARHIAWRLTQHRAAVGDNSAAGLPIKEWKCSGLQRIDIALQEFEASTIFILPQLLPQHINYDLQRFEQVIKDRHHYVIITIEDDKAWRSVFDENLLGRFWKDLQARELYSVEDLAKVLVKRLGQSQEKLPQRLLGSAFKDGTIGTQSILEIAKQLRTPENITDFVTMLCEGFKEGRKLEIAIDEYIKNAQDDLHRMRRWYYSLPGLREQLLTLAVHFFDGLIDDQFFAAVDVLVDQVWQRREQSLLSLDYCDFDQLQHKFFYYVHESKGDAVQLVLRNQRSLILQVAWLQHRRHILSALPVFVRLVRESVAPEPLSWPLYGSSERRERLRRTLSDTISDIGLRDDRSVEETLLRLAIDPHIGVQAVAARAIARWREHREDARLFELVRRWLEEADTIKMITSIIKPEISVAGEKPEDRMKATVGLMIGYAAQFDTPNNVSDPLYQALNRLADSRNQYIRQFLCSFVLPLILPLHFEQVQEIVVKLTSDYTLHAAIAESINQTYRQNPYVINIVSHWYAQGINLTKSKRLAEPLRVALLACISKIYGLLPLGADTQPLNIEQAFEHMRTILENEQDPHVRKAAMATVIRQGRIYFTRLKDIIPRISNEEMNEIAIVMVEIYLDQRQSLSGGNQTRFIHGQLYSVWTNPWERPLTDIEKEMHAWMMDADNTITQQIAYRALIKFRHEFNEEELRRLEQSQESGTSQHPENIFPVATKQPRMTGLHPFDFFLYYVVAWLVAPRTLRYRTIIRGLLPEALQQDTKFPAITRTLFRDYTFLSDNDIAEVTYRLRSAINWAYRRTWFKFGSALLVLAIGIILLALVVKL